MVETGGSSGAMPLVAVKVEIPALQSLKRAETHGARNFATCTAHRRHHRGRGRSDECCRGRGRGRFRYYVTPMTEVAAVSSVDYRMRLADRGY